MGTLSSKPLLSPPSEARHCAAALISDDPSSVPRFAPLPVTYTAHTESVPKCLAERIRVFVSAELFWKGGV